MRDLQNGNRAFLGTVYGNPTVPTSLPEFFSVHPTTVGGVAYEFNVPTYTVDATTDDLVLVLGTKVPVAGDKVIYRRVDDRWVGQKMAPRGTGPIRLLGCPCVVPATLYMTVTNPSNNANVFQTCVIQWMSVPPGLVALQLGAYAFLSTATFVDDLSTDVFRYQLFCSGGFFAITRVYEQSEFGSPFREAYRYRWLPGLYGSTCTPFLFPQGQVFQGGNQGTICKLSG